jgi:signal transduction histidine kinase
VEDVAVFADKKRLRQVLVNLLSNATKYNRDGGSIQVRAESIDNIVRISVMDTGIGIPADKYANVFEPFARISNSVEFTEGTGIGLSISKKLVELMGGAIGFDSEHGKGSTFWIQLRRAEDPES